MALCSYKSVQSSWETEPFSRGAGSGFWASGNLQAAHCQNNTPLSGHIHLLLSHSPAQPSSLLDAIPRDASSRIEALHRAYSLLFLPEGRQSPGYRGRVMKPSPSSPRHRAPLLPLTQVIAGKWERACFFASTLHCWLKARQISAGQVFLF